MSKKKVVPRPKTKKKSPPAKSNYQKLSEEELILSRNKVSQSAKNREIQRAAKRRAELEEERNEEHFKLINGWLDLLKDNELIKDMRIEEVAFSIFLAIPETDRGTQQEFAKQWGVSETTLSLWKLKPAIRKVRGQLLPSLLIDKTPKVIDSLYDAATGTDAYGKKNVPAIKLWLQYVEEFKEGVSLLGGGEGITVNFGGGIGPSPFMTASTPESQKKLAENKVPQSMKAKPAKKVIPKVKLKK
jgi:hypothetical protein